MNRVAIQPGMLQWGRERAGYAIADLEHRFPRLPQWKRGEVLPTLKRVGAFAKAAYTPVGDLFLQQPPIAKVGVPRYESEPILVLLNAPPTRH